MDSQREVQRVIDELSDHVDRSWRRFDYNECVFASVARDCIGDVPLASRLDGFSILTHAASAMATQRPSHRAPEIVPLFRGQRFDVYAHFWLDTIANPHDHAWTGAFQVIEGRSLNGCHVFEQHERVRSTMRIGHLRCERIEVYERGHIVAVQTGNAFIHSVVYDSRFGVAISVRSKQRENPSLTYYRPGVGIEGRARDEEVVNRIAALNFARMLDEQRFLELVEQVLRSSDREMVFFTLVEATEKQWALPQRLLDAAREAHGAGFEPLVTALDDVVRQVHVTELRRQLQSTELRSLLAALYCCDNRAQVAHAVELLHPGRDPWARIGEWLVELLIDPGDEESVPGYFPQAFADIAVGHPMAAICERLTADLRGDLQDRHLEFLASARTAMIEAPLYRALCTPA